MLSYQQVQDKPQVLRSLTGLQASEFATLLVSFEQAWMDYAQIMYHSGGRQRAYGAGRKARLQTVADKLLFILVYFRLYPTQAVQGFLFGLSQPQANDWIHKLTALLHQALGYEQQLPEREPARLADVLRRCPSLEFMLDGTERPIQRPQNKVDRKTYYSGKKKRHTVTNLVVTHRRGKVMYLSDTYEGKKHDKAIADAESYQFPKGSQLWQDTGFQGFAPTDVQVHQPKKKPRGGELTDDEKATNRAISSIRVLVEHHIGSVKRLQILVQPFRNWADHYIDDVMEIACGLHNFRLEQRQKQLA